MARLILLFCINAMAATDPMARPILKPNFIIKIPPQLVCGGEDKISLLLLYRLFELFHRNSVIFGNNVLKDNVVYVVFHRLRQLFIFTDGPNKQIQIVFIAKRMYAFYVFYVKRDEIRLGFFEIHDV